MSVLNSLSLRYFEAAVIRYRSICLSFRPELLCCKGCQKASSYQNCRRCVDLRRNEARLPRRSICVILTEIPNFFSFFDLDLQLLNNNIVQKSSLQSLRWNFKNHHHIAIHLPLRILQRQSAQFRAWVCRI